MSQKPKEKAVIIGYGWVGQANALALSLMGYPVFYFDVVAPQARYPEYEKIYEKIRPLDSPLSEESENTWYLVCVGDRVDEKGNQDISLIKQALDSVKNSKGRVILRSTVLPQHLKGLDFDFYVPEFLHEKKGVEESLNPYYFVVGKRENGTREPDFLVDWEKKAYKVFRGAPEDASYIKYLSNIWNAVRIAFVNEAGDIISKPDESQSVARLERILDFVFEKSDYLRYGKSFGGHCLPKDLLAFSAVNRDKNVSLLEAAFRSNLTHKEMESRYELPEWYSFWNYKRPKGLNRGYLGDFWRKVNLAKPVRSVKNKIKPLANFTLNLFSPGRSLPDVKKTWDDLAYKNASFFMNTKTRSREAVDEFEFRQTGQEDYMRYILEDGVLREKLGVLRDKKVLEIGCGAGRMTEFFAKDFKEVHGLDISGELVDYAKHRLYSLDNVSFAVNDGKSIPYGNGYFDLIFSYLVLQHIPEVDIVQDYFKDIKRTLKPGGLAKIQLRTGPGIQKWHWSYGVSLAPARAYDLAQQAGLEVLKHEVEGTKNLWLWLGKK